MPKQLRITDGCNVTTYDFVTNGCGYVEIAVEYKAVTNVVLIEVDNSDVSVSKSIISERNRGGCSSCGNYDNDTRLIINGYYNGSNTNFNYGVFADVRLDCDAEKVVCLLKKQVATMVLHKAGIEVFNEWLVSNRLNEETLDATVENIKSTLVLYEQRYKKDLQHFADNAQYSVLGIKDECVKCKGYFLGNQFNS